MASSTFCSVILYIVGYFIKSQLKKLYFKKCLNNASSKIDGYSNRCIIALRRSISVRIVLKKIVRLT